MTMSSRSFTRFSSANSRLGEEDQDQLIENTSHF